MERDGNIDQKSMKIGRGTEGGRERDTMQYMMMLKTLIQYDVVRGMTAWINTRG